MYTVAEGDGDVNALEEEDRLAPSRDRITDSTKDEGPLGLPEMTSDVDEIPGAPKSRSCSLKVGLLENASDGDIE